MSGPVPAVEIRDLRLAAGGRTLLEGASLRVEPGELLLLVGLSGTGKSLTLALLMDLLDRDDPALEVEGRVELFGEPAARAARDRAGIVFQDFGLLDEWSPRRNVAFGVDHARPRPGRAEGKARVDELLSAFHLPEGGTVAALSGGMKQRCALARTLAYDPDVLVYDEPTSGLDPAMSARVARRIRETNDRFDKTSVVVTHDLAALQGIADRIVLLDPGARRFREVGAEEVGAVLEELRRLEPPPDPVRAPGRRRPAALIRDALEASGRVVEASGRAALALLPRYPDVRWGLRYLLWYLRLTTLGSALVYVAIAGFVLGLIVTWFTFSFLPFKEFTEPLLMDRIVGAIGYALYRITVPGMTAMLVAARSGAALAADVGNRVYGRQVAAMRSFGVAPERYILTNALWAHLLGMPLLVAVNFAAARLASLVVFVVVHPEESTFFWSSQFERFLGGGDTLFREGTGWLLAKSQISAFGVAAIACFQGLRPKRSGRDVAAAVTRTIIWATLFVLLVQLVAALLEFEPL